MPEDIIAAGAQGAARTEGAGGAPRRARGLGDRALPAGEFRPHPPRGARVPDSRSSNPEDEIVVYCHHGVRSAAVANFLRGQGFAKAVNLAGGLDLWAQSVDRAMRRY